MQDRVRSKHYFLILSGRKSFPRASQIRASSNNDWHLNCLNVCCSKPSYNARRSPSLSQQDTGATPLASRTPQSPRLHATRAEFTTSPRMRAQLLKLAGKTAKTPGLIITE